MSEPFQVRLLTASFRGVEFHVSAASETTGRRFQRFDFPGRDAPAHEDMGAIDGPIRLTALLIGNDVLEQVEALKHAVRQPGPGRLVHPWAGEFEAVIAPGTPPDFSWDEREGRVARVSLTFERTGASDPQAQSGPRPTAASPAAAAGVRQASDMMLALLTARDLLALAGLVVSLADRLELLFARRIRGGTPPVLLPILTRMRLLAGAPATLPGGYTALGSEIVTRLALQRPPALAGVARPDNLSMPQRHGAVAALIEAAEGLPPAEGLPLLAAAVEVAPALKYDSRDDALAMRDRLAGAAAVQARAISRIPATAVAGVAGARAMLWQSAMILRDATHHDMSQRAGTLPSVRHWLPRAGTPALVGLQRLYGDDPASLPERLADMQRRNRTIRHPGSLPAARLEILDR